MKLINTEKAPEAIGPYSQAIIANGFMFISGQLPVDPATNTVLEDDVIKQTNQVLKNVTAILQSQDLDLNNIVKNTIFIRDMSQFSTINEEYSKYFAKHKPSRTCVEVSSLPKNALIEIEVIASTYRSDE